MSSTGSRVRKLIKLTRKLKEHLSNEYPELRIDEIRIHVTQKGEFIVKCMKDGLSIRLTWVNELTKTPMKLKVQSDSEPTNITIKRKFNIEGLVK